MRPRPFALFLNLRANNVRPYLTCSLICRGRRPRRPVLAPEGSIGEKQKSVKNRAALLHGLAFLLLDLLFGVLRGSGTFSLPFWSQKGRPLWMQPIIKGRHRMVVTPARHNIKFKFPASSKPHLSNTPDAHGKPNPPRQGWPRPPRSHPRRPHRRPQHSRV